MAVFVLDKKHQPLMPCTEKRARLLLKKRKARIHSMYPFTIRLINRTVQESVLQPLRCKIDPGSKVTGIAIVREDFEQQVVISLVELTHRGSVIREALQARAGKRRRRRSSLRYRSPRFANRTKPNGWLPPSLRHRIETVMSWVHRLKARACITAITCERVSFDTQKMTSPEIQNVEYSQGTLLGYEIREYLLERWGRKCTYCNVQNVPLQIDHIVPKSCGGSNRIDNLTLACASCNQKKSNLPLTIFNPKLAQKLPSITPLRDAAAVNSTRNVLWQQLIKLLLPCEAGTGGQTKYNRNRLGIPKTHALDAVCTGTIFQIQNCQIPTLQIRCTGRGSYQRTRTDRFGFPRGFLLRKKKVHGFEELSPKEGRDSPTAKGRQVPCRNWIDSSANSALKSRDCARAAVQTGDQVISSVPSGKKKGCYTGRVAIRTSGNFNIQTKDGVIQGINSKYCHLVQHADGYHYLGNTNPQLEEQRFLPVLKDQVSALSIG